MEGRRAWPACHLLAEGGELSLGRVLAQGAEHGTHVGDGDGASALLVEEVEILQKRAG